MSAVALAVVLASGCANPTEPGGSISMSATVNGLPWHPGGPGVTPPGATFSEGQQVLSFGGLFAVASPYHAAGIAITLTHVSGPGTYVLADRDSTSSGLYDVWDGSLTDSTFTTTWYFTSAAATGTVVVSQFDPATRTVAGTFSFEAESATGTRVV